MTSQNPKTPLRILVSNASLQSLASLLGDVPELSVELLDADQQLPGVEFDIALISRDVTATSTKQKTIPSTQKYYDLLLGSNQVKWVHIHSAGADRPIYLDLMSRGVKVTGSSGVNAPVVTQNAIAGILMLARRFPQMMRAQAERKWDSLINYPLPLDLAGQTALILGRGPIGKGIAEVLKILGVKTIMIGFDLLLKEQSNHSSIQEGTRHISELSQVLPLAQWLVIACPLSQETKGLIDRENLNLLPAGAHVINIARGEIPVEVDLIEALESGKLAGAYLDVFAAEPLDENSPLWSMNNVIVTPHSAGHSAGNEQRVLALFIENLRRYALGEHLKNQINPS